MHSPALSDDESSAALARSVSHTSSIVGHAPAGYETQVFEYDEGGAPVGEAVEQHFATVLQHTGCREYVRILSVRVRNTATCLFVYVLLFTLNLFMLCWELFGYEAHSVFVVLESIINVTLVMEVGIGILTEGRRYWSKWLNRLDFIVTLFCVLFFVVYLIEEEYSSDPSNDLTLVDSLLIFTRYVVQIGRLAFLTYRGRKTTEFFGQEDVRIDFTAEDDEHHGADRDDIERRALISRGPSSHSRSREVEMQVRP